MTAGVPLKRLVHINLRTLPETTDPLVEFEYLDVGAVGRGRLLEEPALVSFGAAPTRARRVVQEGDTIVSTVRTYLRAVWSVPRFATSLVVSTGFAVLTPTPALDARFLGWLAQSDLLVENIVARSVGVSYPAINASEIGEIRVPLPPLARQRATADFLTAETGRIDMLISRRRDQLRLLRERFATFVDTVVWRDAPVRALRHCVEKLTVGIVVQPASWYAPDGDDGAVPAVRAIDVSPFSIREADLVRITAEGHRLHPKSELRTGDVVVVRTGQAGVAAVVPPTLDGANCISNLIIRCGTAYDAEFLACVFNSSRVRGHVDAESVGAIQQHFGVDAASRLPVPDLPLPEQRARAAGVRIAGDKVDRLVRALETQVDALEERRRTVVNRAVSGDPVGARR